MGVILILLGVACSKPSFSDKVYQRANSAADAGKTVSLAEIEGNEWDFAYMFGAYTSADFIEKTLGFKWKGAKSTGIEDHDGISLVVFVKDNEVTKWHQVFPPIRFDLSETNAITRQHPFLTVKARSQQLFLKPSHANSTNR